MAETWTTVRVLDWTTRRFSGAGFASPRLEAQILLAHALGCDRVALYTSFDKPLAAPELAGFRTLIKRRLAGEPVAYLVGEQEFWSLPFTVDERVLIPRHDSETVIELVLDEIGDRGQAVHIADIATGAGPLAVTLAHELRAARVVATDIDPGALALAGENAARNGVAERVELRSGDLLGAVGPDQQFDVLVANLPYIPSADIAGLSAEVRHEPAAALDGGPDGLVLVRRLLAEVADYVAASALVALEHGFDQGPAVVALFAATAEFFVAETRCDLGGQPRVTFARRR